ncbi:hypothetical protein NDU88_001943 [Pleurodeles waltl]|uniref:Uncharacterized protein n=1 Tax=Pleurodeles waltl TaxID=8319 RepID=A0AAV7P8K6_PLEWA|nr:hypothetical protein NDU88_001943 [Pleurodeles waltl]
MGDLDEVVAEQQHVPQIFVPQEPPEAVFSLTDGGSLSDSESEEHEVGGTAATASLKDWLSAKDKGPALCQMSVDQRLDLVLFQPPKFKTVTFTQGTPDPIPLSEDELLWDPDGTDLIPTKMSLHRWS